ncbi:MAG: hypothetical protein MUC97_14565 [Bernardetiaceae bacterium]|nr:hypothetical protein [Bernardetiaceae bacterium]
MNWADLLGVAGLFGLAGLGFRATRRQPMRAYWWPGLLVKLLAGIGVGILYKYHYGFGDLLTAYEQSRSLAALLLENPTEFWRFPQTGPTTTYLHYLGDFRDLNPRVIFFAKFGAGVYLLAGGNFWTMSAYYSALSFAGLWLAANAIARQLGRGTRALALGFLGFPSVVFWSAGLLKESLLWTFLGALLAGFLHFYPRPTPPRNNLARLYNGLALSGLTMGAAGLWLLKYYYLAAALPALAGAWAVYRAGQRWRLGLWAQAGLFGALVPGLAALATQLHPNLYPTRMLASLLTNNQLMANETDVDNLVYYPHFTPDLAGLVASLPQAWWTGLAVPLPWQWHGNPLKLAAGLENLAVLLALLGMKRPKNHLRADVFPLFLATVTYIAGLAALLALATPNLGTLLRYKVGYFPLVVSLIALHYPRLNR